MFLYWSRCPPQFQGPCFAGSCNVAAGACFYTLATACINPQPSSPTTPQPSSYPSPSVSIPTSIIIFLDCIETTSTGYTIFIGYNSTFPVSVTIPVGPNNTFSPGLSSLGQPTTFNPGSYSGYPFSPFNFKVNTATPLTWTLNSQSLVIDPSNILQPCPSATTVLITISSTPTSVNQGQTIQQLESALSAATNSNVTVDKVAANSNSEVYAVTFNGNQTNSASAAALAYCSQTNPSVVNQINGITSGSVSNTGCPGPESSISPNPISQDNGTGFKFLWWYGAIIGGVALVIIIVVVVIILVSKATTEVV